MSVCASVSRTFWNFLELSRLLPRVASFGPRVYVCACECVRERVEFFSAVAARGAPLPARVFRISECVRERE